jgi:predicted nucleotidyltransferase
MRSFRDRDYLITPEGFIFAVIGNLHPADRVIAYLKYIPDELGKWGRDRQRFRRALQHYNVPSVVESMRFLSTNAPRYLFESSVHSITLSAVPMDAIAAHLRPEERLLQLRIAEHRDELENKALRLAELISQEANVPAQSIGVTGSILAQIHDPGFSDIDLVVYGFNNSLRVRNSLRNLKESSSGMVRRLAGASLEKWITERLNSTPLTRQNAIDLFARKWNIGLFSDTEFSVHAVHTEAEISRRYGDERYVPLEIVEATAKVVDSKESLFMPAVYRIESVNLEGGFTTYTIDRIVSFEGLYADIAEEGDAISCRGKLERVESSSGIGHRILVGSPEAQGTDFILASDATRRR